MTNELIGVLENATLEVNVTITETGPRGLQGIVDYTYVDNGLELKADKTYVDSQDLLKADKTEVATSLELKADKTYVDSQDLLKADKTYVDTKLSEKADKQQEAWITPTLLNGWENESSGTPVRYYKDTMGRVHFRGALKGGTNNTEAFTLPVGYRPTHISRFVGMISDSTVGRIDIDGLGNVSPNKGASTYIYLVNISFKGGL